MSNPAPPRAPKGSKLGMAGRFGMFGSRGSLGLVPDEPAADVPGPPTSFKAFQYLSRPAT